jgi:hypothetical protein
MHVTIQKKHTVGTLFDKWKDDALVRALREQHPEFPVRASLEDFVSDKNNNHYEFDNSEDTGYCRASFARLQRGEIKEIKLELKLAS